MRFWVSLIRGNEDVISREELGSRNTALHTVQ
jgi:hypothetical protein